MKTDPLLQSNALVTQHLALVRSIAARYASPRYSLDDLVSEGNLALLRAARAFDASRGVPFANYAYGVIDRSIRGYFSTAGSVVRMPAKVRRERGRVRRATERFFASCGRRPTAAELSDTIGDLGEGWKDPMSDESIRAPCDELLFDASVAGHEENTGNEEAAARLAKEVESLPDRVRHVVQLRFGLGGGQGRRENEIATALDMSVREVRRCLEIGLRHLRNRAAGTRAGDEPLMAA